MADQLATLQNLADALQIDLADLNTGTGNLLLDIGTAVVQQAAGGQRIVEVVDDTVTVMGTTESWLNLPQIPVTDVESVTLDGTALTEGYLDTRYWRRFGNRLWRSDGWQTYMDMPSEVVVVCTHGYATGSWQLEFARAAVLGIIKGAYPNPSSVASERIDDYAVTYSALSAQLEASPSLKAAIHKAYGRRGGLVRIG